MGRVSSMHIIAAHTLRTCSHGLSEDRPQRTRRKIAFIPSLAEICVSSLHSISVSHILGAWLKASRRFWERTGLALSMATLGVWHIKKHL